MKDFNFIYETTKNTNSYDKLYSMFATNFELNSLAKRIYANTNICSHKISLAKKCCNE